MATQIMNRPDEVGGPDKETLYMLGGVALVIFGAGLVLSNPTVRRYLGKWGWAILPRRHCPTWNDISVCVPCKVGRQGS